jgi:hypothetical protein
MHSAGTKADVYVCIDKARYIATSTCNTYFVSKIWTRDVSNILAIHTIHVHMHRDFKELEKFKPIMPGM